MISGCQSVRIYSSIQCSSCSGDCSCIKCNYSRVICKLEGCDFCCPGTPSAKGSHKFLGCPERSVIRRIHTHGRIIAPPRISGHRNGSCMNKTFGNCHGIQWIGSFSSCKIDRRIHGTAGNRICQRNIPAGIHCNTSHPPGFSISWCIG